MNRPQYETLLYILSITLQCISVKAQRSRTDMNKCKVSHTGIEYMGTISHTASGLKCRVWTSYYHAVLDISGDTQVVRDSDFPEMNNYKARDYCRNAAGKFNSPWCYTENEDVSDELCTVPLCNFPCRRTLIGAEYGGHVQESVTGRRCLKWSEKIYRKYLNKVGIAISERVLLDEKFPELSRKKASNYCRNPTGDPNGLWCLVEDEFAEIVKYEKEYCDISLCDAAECTNCLLATSSFTAGMVHSHYFGFNSSQELEFSMTLWNLNMENSTFRMAFSPYPLPLSGQEMVNIDSGLEIFIGKHGIGFTKKKGTDINSTDIINMISGYEKVDFVITFYPKTYHCSVKISKSLVTIETSYFVAEKGDDQENSIISGVNGELYYFSIMGDVALWEFPKLPKCQEEITILPECNVHRKMNKVEGFHKVSFAVRSYATVYIELRYSPNSYYPFIKIEILGAYNATYVSLKQSEDSTFEYLSGTIYPNILSYWSWSEFVLSSTGDRLQLDWKRVSIPSETIFSVQHVTLANAKWYSICSKTTAYWRLECESQDIPIIPPVKLPECIRSKKGESYRGIHQISNTGRLCFPWVYEELDEITKDFLLPDAKLKDHRNYCRNLNSDSDGPFCYVAETEKLPKLVMVKEWCDLRRCTVDQCKSTGMGREYDGSRNVSRSNRPCNKWSEYEIEEIIDASNLTASLKENYCRNWNNNVFGPFCYTSDPNLRVDLCEIRDCTINDACTYINIAADYSYKIYFRPEWISDKFVFFVKSWDPQHPIGIALNISFENSTDYFILEIGSNDNTKVVLKYFEENSGNLITLKEKLIPRLIPSGYWQGFWIRVPPYNIEIGYEESVTNLFSWENVPGSGIPSRYCKYLSIINLEKYPVGLNFRCDYCLIYQIFSNTSHAYFPFHLGRPSIEVSDLYLKIRTDRKTSNGSIIIYLYADNELNYLTFEINSTHIVLFESEKFVNFLNLTARVVLRETVTSRDILTDSFVDFEIRYNESYVSIESLTERLSYSYRKKVLKIYYYSIAAENLVISWLSNCGDLIDEGPAINGGWSEWSSWTCNVRCGGGIGYRTRKCDNPVPNFKGNPCLGENSEEGECNPFECGCVNPDTYKKINTILQSEAINKEAKEGEDVVFQCERSIVQEVKNDSSGSQLEWLRNGYRIFNSKLSFDKLTLEKTDLKLSNVQEDHSGVYMCVLFPECPSPDNATMVPIKIIALVVNSNQIHEIRETRDFQLICKGLVLSFIYADLRQSWELDNDLMIDYEDTPLSEVEMDNILEINPIYNGEWTCKITQTTLNLTWITNRFRLNVTDPPSLWSYLTTEDAPSLIFHGWSYKLVIVFLWAIIILEIIGLIYTLYWYWTTRRELLGKTEN